MPPGSDGLLFLPYLSGERTPYPDPRARGAFVGLAARHGRPHMTRSVLEGVAFGLRDSLELMRAVGVGGFDEVRATGGGSKSALWRQILADVLEMTVVTTTTSEGAAQGAAMLAATALAGSPTWRMHAGRLVTLGERVEPSMRPRVPRAIRAVPLALSGARRRRSIPPAEPVRNVARSADERQARIVVRRPS